MGFWVLLLGIQTIWGGIGWIINTQPAPQILIGIGLALTLVGLDDWIRKLR